MLKIIVNGLAEMPMSDLKTQLEELVATKKVSYDSARDTLTITRKKHTVERMEKLAYTLECQFHGTHIEVMSH